MEYRGNPVSKGIAIGTVYHYTPFLAQVDTAPIPPESADAALAEYTRAQKAAEQELAAIQAKLVAQGADEAKIFAAHNDILHDMAMDEEIRDAISYAYQSPSMAVNTVFTQYADLLSQTADPIIRERAADLKDVRDRLLRCLAGVEERNLAALNGPVIVVAHDLLPSDTATMDRKNVLAIVTEVGGATSHSAILARSYEIPALLGIPEISSALHEGEAIIVDALDGILLTEPDGALLSDYQARRERHLTKVAEEKRYLAAKPVTLDGVALEIDLNIGSAEDQELINAPYVDGVGLFRTEFLYMNRPKPPDEEEQYQIYTKVLKAFGQRPVTLRTLDIGGDKQVECLPLPKEQNPFLGNRALRFCLSQEELFLTQLRAALRASVHGTLWLMFPMVGSLEDIRRAKAMVERAKEQLTARGQVFSPSIRLGVMVEIPALAMIADQMVAEVDFASIGTNDLTQYLTAADRGEPAVAQYYQFYHPAVFRLIRIVADAFTAAGKPLCVCGELGGDAAGAMALIGLGLRRLSMGAASLATVKKLVCSITIQQACTAAGQACACPTAAETEAVLTAAVTAAYDQ